nr:hypothetical protein [Deltaproteobacteria bacterium]
MHDRRLPAPPPSRDGAARSAFTASGATTERRFTHASRLSPRSSSMAIHGVEVGSSTPAATTAPRGPESIPRADAGLLLEPP